MTIRSWKNYNDLLIEIKGRRFEYRSFPIYDFFGLGTPNHNI